MPAPRCQPSSAPPRWLELWIIALLQWIPLTPGRILRRLLYRMVLAHIGAHVTIEPGVEFAHAGGIWLGDGAILRRDVRIRCFGKTSRIHIHPNVQIDRGVDIRAHWQAEISIGEQTRIGPYTCLSGDRILIGNHCLIASHVSIYANNHVFDDPTRLIREQGNRYKGIVIEDDCWLGSGVRVVDGITIGQGSVIGAGAVVTKDVPPYSIAVGVPAKVIAQRSGDSQVQAMPSLQVYQDADQPEQHPTRV